MEQLKLSVISHQSSSKTLSLRRFIEPVAILIQTTLTAESRKLKANNQKGFSTPILLVILTVGIVAAVWLTQTDTNFIPWAAEQEGLNPSAGKTKNCANEENKDQCQKDNDVICAKDTVTYCDNRTGSPRAIRKSGGYYNPSHANTDPASGCVFDYREVSGKNTECGKTESKSGDVVYTTKDEAEKLDKDRRDTLPQRERESQGRGSGSGSPAGTVDPVCTETGTEQAMKDEKVTGNLIRYYAILAGQPNYCTPADLGVSPKKEAAGQSGQGRLMLCSKDDASLTWRVLVNNKLESSTKANPSKEEAQSEMSANLEEALKVASPTQSTLVQSDPPTEPAPAAPASAETRLIPSLSIELDTVQGTCGIEGTTCKFFTNGQKNDGIIFYTGKIHVEFNLIAPNGKQVQIKLENESEDENKKIVPKSQIKSAAGLESYLVSIQDKIDWTNFATRWNSYGGQILLPKVGFVPPVRR